MMSTTGLNASNNLSYNNLSKYPFTPTQWQELEQQALIYKYMSSGIPIPSDLLLPIKRSSFNNFFPHPPPTMVPTWSCYQQLGGAGGGGGGGYNSSIGRRAAEDPEPGRCRRTDGKKWRCSKEAYPNSKYCERHMHRGKNRSRKPVETPAITPSSSSLNITTPATHIISSNSSTYPFFYPYSSPTHSDYSSWELRPLGLGEPRQRREEEKEKHCFVLGADFKQEEHQRQVKERDFFDGWTSTNANTNTNTSGNNNTSQKSKGLSWMGFNHHQGDSSTTQGPSSASSYSKTQLTISIPMGLHDFPQ